MGKRVRDLHGPEYIQARSLIQELDRIRNEKKMSQMALNHASGYSQSGLSEWFSFQMPNYALVTLIRIAKGLGYRVNITFEREDA